MTSSLAEIEKEILSCKICPIGKSGKAVVGEGNNRANVMFVGEAPGRNEALTGRPFIGRSGQLLRSQIRSIGLAEEDVYITSPVKYLPDRGTPTREDIEHGKIHLGKQIKAINPKFIVVLGATASKALIDRPVFIAKEHGTIVQQGSINYFLMYHPAAAIRFQKFKKPFVEDFQKLKKLLLIK